MFPQILVIGGWVILLVILLKVLSKGMTLHFLFVVVIVFKISYVPLINLPNPTNFWPLLGHIQGLMCILIYFTWIYVLHQTMSYLVRAIFYQLYVITRDSLGCFVFIAKIKVIMCFFCLKYGEKVIWCKLWAIQIDGGNEFKPLMIELYKEGIAHILTCSYTFELNGVVQCRHRRIVEHGLVVCYEGYYLLVE